MTPKKDPLFSKLGERIRTFRKRSRFTQAQLAEKADISVNFIGNAERGESAASVRTLKQIASALGVNIRDLFDFPDADRNAIILDILTLLKNDDLDIDVLRGIQIIIRNLVQR